MTRSSRRRERHDDPPKPQRARAWSLLLALAAGSCASVGPAVVDDRTDYNHALQRTSNEQLLLNLVRLRYRDTVFFMQPSTIATSFSRRTTASVGVDLLPSRADPWGLGASTMVTEAPTITYTPLQGQRYVSQLMTPVPIRLLLLLYHSGWSIDRILRVCTQSLNTVVNAPSASGPTPCHAPRFAKFRRVCRELRALQRKGLLTIGTPEDAEDESLQLRLTGSGHEGAATFADIAELLDLEAGGTIRLRCGVGGGVKDAVTVLPRSVLASLYFLSQGVETPKAHEQAGFVTVTEEEFGGRFDWQRVVGGLFRVRSSRSRPEHAHVATRYRGFWFWIDDDDLDTKSTFGLVHALLALQSGEIGGDRPVLTIPTLR